MRFNSSCIIIVFPSCSFRINTVCWSWGCPALKAYWDKGFILSSYTFAPRARNTRSWGQCTSAFDAKYFSSFRDPHQINLLSFHCVQEAVSTLWGGVCDGGCVPGRGAAAGDTAPALSHLRAQHLELHWRAAGRRTQCHSYPTEGSSMGRTGQAPVEHQPQCLPCIIEIIGSHDDGRCKYSQQAGLGLPTQM